MSAPHSNVQVGHWLARQVRHQVRAKSQLPHERAPGDGPRRVRIEWVRGSNPFSSTHLGQYIRASVATAGKRRGSFVTHLSLTQGDIGGHGTAQNGTTSERECDVSWPVRTRSTGRRPGGSRPP
jgi:hypothetical protein